MNQKQEMLEYIQENSGIATISDLEYMFYNDNKDDDEFLWRLYFDKEKNQIAWITRKKEFYEDILDLSSKKEIIVQSTSNPIIIFTSKMLNLPITKNPRLNYKNEHWTPCIVLDGNQHRDFWIDYNEK